VPFTYDYARPAVTVDVALFGVDASGELQILLIRRRNEPFAGRWALPGGFVDPDEDLPTAAKRELHEETGLRAPRLVQLGAYGKPGRDPRGRTISIIFLATCDPRTATLLAGDDAAACEWFAARRPPPLAFDHRRVVVDARLRLAELAQDRPAFARLLFAPRAASLVHAVRRAALA
jgi:8-oxo-dGTP diphosphatase